MLHRSGQTTEEHIFWGQPQNKEKAVKKVSQLVTGPELPVNLKIKEKQSKRLVGWSQDQSSLSTSKWRKNSLKG